MDQSISRGGYGRIENYPEMLRRRGARWNCIQIFFHTFRKESLFSWILQEPRVPWTAENSGTGRNIGKLLVYSPVLQMKKEKSKDIK